MIQSITLKCPEFYIGDTIIPIIYHTSKAIVRIKQGGRQKSSGTVPGLGKMLNQWLWASSLPSE